MSDALSVCGLCKSYPSFTLDGISFSVPSGSIMGFVGRNGAGKTTTLKSLMNLVHPDAGKIEFFGMPLLGNEKRIKQRVGYAQGGVQYYPRKRLHEITAITKRFYDRWDEASYDKYMTAFRLDAGKKVMELSEGMKVKYSLALALSHGAEFLILDEPTSGLDPVSRDELLTIFEKLAQKGTTILFSTHITSDLEKIADSITYIKAGRLIGSGKKEDFIREQGGGSIEEIMIRLEREDVLI